MNMAISDKVRRAKTEKMLIQDEINKPKKRYRIISWNVGDLNSVSVIDEETQDIIKDFTVGDYGYFIPDRPIASRKEAKRLAREYIKFVLNGEIEED